MSTDTEPCGGYEFTCPAYPVRPIGFMGGVPLAEALRRAEANMRPGGLWPGWSPIVVWQGKAVVAVLRRRGNVIEVERPGTAADS
jgi:hypothetical protein